MTDLTERLRECPFCGGDATIVFSDLRPCNVDGWTDGYSVFCRQSVRCSGRLPKFHKTRVEAIAAWNKRPTLETLTQENARLREAGWRDIESAPGPTDEFSYYGPLILVWDGENVSAAKKDRTGSFTDLEMVDRDGDWMSIFPNPTHWMPLPPAPARKALGGGDE